MENEWENVKFCFRLLAFDDPSPWMNNEPFERRYARILTSVELVHPFLVYFYLTTAVVNDLLLQVVVSRVLCCDPRLLTLSERYILGDGGEGIILRLPCSLYHHGRSTSLLKWKVIFSFFMC